MSMYSYANQGRLRPPAYRPGFRPYANTGHGRSKEYANAAGGRKASATLDVTLAGTANPGDRFEIFVGAPTGERIPVQYVVPDPKPSSAADVHQSVLDALIDDVRVAGFGRWASDASGVSFESIAVGQQFSLSHNADSSIATVNTSVTQGQGFGQYVKPARVVVADSTVNHEAIDDAVPLFGMGKNEVAFLITQDLSDPAATQRWQGLTMDTKEEMGEVFTGFPAYTNEGSMPQHPQPQLSVSLHGPLTVDLETPFAGGSMPQLNYRYQADGAKNDIGILTFESGAGLAPVPVDYSVDEITNDGMIAVIDFSKA